MLSILVIVLVALLLFADSLIFMAVGISIGAKDAMKYLEDKGWVITPPEGEGMHDAQ